MKRYRKASDITVGVIGYGGAFNMGKLHLDEMRQAGMTPVAVADVDPRRLEAARKDFPGIAAYRSVGRMLKDSDVSLLAIVTPHSTHAPLALQCLKAGRHVVCEKPFALTTAECDAMIAAARRHRVLLSTYHNRHWDGCIVQALRTLRTGVIGDLVRVDMHTGGWSQPRDWWRSSKRLSGGILYDWGVHLLEYALQIVQADIREVSGFAHRGFWAPRTAWKGDTVEDDAFLVVRFSSGVWCTLGMSHVESRPRPGWVDITGTKGSYIMEGANWELITHDEGVTVSRRGVNPPSAWWRFYRNLADHLTRGASLVITPEWARRPIHILDLADRSARLGRALPARYA